MANKTIRDIKGMAQKSVANIDLRAVKHSANVAAGVISEKAAEVKDTAISAKEDIEEKLTELDRMLDQEVTKYNDAYTLMNDKGVKLYIERCRALDLIAFVEGLVNSIANRPKSFDTDFEEINMSRRHFSDSCDFADRELRAARGAASSAGAGLAAGASVAFMAPTAAMWIATTFGTASTGAAISTLSGAAATNAALAWLGGGALATGGGGMVAGEALLALAGPVGWTIAGATLLSSILLFNKKRAKLNKQKYQEIEAVKENTERILEMDAQLSDLLKKTEESRLGLSRVYSECAVFFGSDYTLLSGDQKQGLASLLNYTKVLSSLYDQTIAHQGAENAE